MFRIGESCWLTPGEQDEAIAGLVEAGLISCDNKRSLPLKSGGKTDIYVNLRMARNSPGAIRLLARLFENPLRRLGVDRVVEVPEAVSPLAGHISAITDIPLVTIREEVKAGRVVGGKFIGDIRFNDLVAIMDDVITDGASKLAALTEISRIGARLAALVVLVDRQQGWKKKLAEAGFGSVPVWAGMTLHDIRRFLITQKLMQRCEPETEEKNPIIVALDGKNWEDILPLIDQLRTTGCILKVNDLLMDQGISSLIPQLSVYGRVMADLKCHDIPNTVGNTCKRLRVCPPWAVTVHASGADEMIKAAKKELKGLPTKVLAVTVLTSIDEKTCEEVYSRKPLEEVLQLAKIAHEAGADGFVCSPEEVSHLRMLYGDKVLVTPGIRSPGTAVEDQKRIETPKNARDQGANHLVMGRQILGAKDPVAEVRRVITEELGITL